MEIVMEGKVSKLIRHISRGSSALIAFTNLTWAVSAQAVERVAVGVNPAAIRPAADQFRADKIPLQRRSTVSE